MLFTPRKKRHFTLTGDTNSAVLAEIIRKQSGKPTLKVLAQSEGAIIDEFTYPRLLSNISESLYGEMSVALPLHCFEILTITLPMMPDEALDRALPYHLAKATDKPLSEFIYDWQVTQRQKDKLQVTVYMLPAKLFNQMKTEFARKQITVQHLEADIFAAYAYLDSNDRLVDEEPSLCVIIWPENVSLAVYEKNTLILARTVHAVQPETEFKGISQDYSVEESRPDDSSLDLEPELVVQLKESEKDSEKVVSGFEGDSEDASILEDFDLLSKSPAQKELEPEVEAPISTEEISLEKQDTSLKTEDNTWEDYLQHINLEIMRTRDYLTSVLKGSAVKNVYVTGADKFWEELRSTTRNALGIDMEKLGEKPATEISPTFNVICLGTGTR